MNYKPALNIDQKCGFRYVSQPEGSSYRDIYETDFYEREKPDYLSKSELETVYWTLLWEQRLTRVENCSGKRGLVLDIGAGGGFFLKTARSCKWFISGIEPSRIARKFAQEKFDIHLDKGFLEEELIRIFSPDFINLCLVLEHMEDPRKILGILFKEMKPEAMLWIEVPNDFSSLQKVITNQLGKTQWWIVPKHHVNYFDFNSLGKLLEDVGFLEIDRMGSYPMELFALMGKDYIGDDEVGAEIHEMRMKMEMNIINEDPNILLNMYRSFARAGIGRTCNFLVQKPK